MTDTATSAELAVRPDDTPDVTRTHATPIDPFYEAMVLRAFTATFDTPERNIGEEAIGIWLGFAVVFIVAVFASGAALRAALGLLGA